MIQKLIEAIKELAKYGRLSEDTKDSIEKLVDEEFKDNIDEMLERVGSTVTNRLDNMQEQINKILHHHSEILDHLNINIKDDEEIQPVKRAQTVRGKK